MDDSDTEKVLITQNLAKQPPEIRMGTLQHITK